MEMEKSFLVQSENYFLSIASAWPREHDMIQFSGTIIYIGVFETFPHMNFYFQTNVCCQNPLDCHICTFLRSAHLKHLCFIPGG